MANVVKHSADAFHEKYRTALVLNELKHQQYFWISKDLFELVKWYLPIEITMFSVN